MLRVLEKLPNRCTNTVKSFNRLLSSKVGREASGRQLNRTMRNHLPFFAVGEIVKGFGRGSKELGIPTANYSLEVVKSLPPPLQTGIYYGWANVDNGEVHKMVMSIGWNPYYENKQKSMETHIMHNFNRDLYGCILKVCIVGFLRAEKNFDSLEALITAIQNDISESEKLLDDDAEALLLKDSKFFNEALAASTCAQTDEQNAS